MSYLGMDREIPSYYSTLTPDRLAALADAAKPQLGYDPTPGLREIHWDAEITVYLQTAPLDEAVAWLVRYAQERTADRPRSANRYWDEIGSIERP